MRGWPTPRRWWRRCWSSEVDVDCRHLLLAGRCAAEAVRLDQAVRERTMARLRAQFETCSGQRFLEVGQVLAEIAGEDAVGFFLRVAQEEPARREAALWALGQMAQQPNEALRERVVAQLDGCPRTARLARLGVERTGQD